MRISYNKLWKLLIDKNMKKMELKDAAGISAASIAKLGRGDNVTTDILLRICETLHVHLEDIMETIDDDTDHIKHAEPAVKGEDLHGSN